MGVSARSQFGHQNVTANINAQQGQPAGPMGGQNHGRCTMSNWKVFLRLSAGAVLATSLVVLAADAEAAGQCTPGKTGRIAFMLKQQTAFRYLNADVPFFKKTAEAAGFQVVMQSAENDAQAQVAQAENVLTQGVDAIVIQPVDFNVAARIAEMASEAGVPLA